MKNQSANLLPGNTQYRKDVEAAADSGDRRKLAKALAAVRQTATIVAAGIADRERHEFETEAVNWADFRCVDAELVENSYGQRSLQVRIEEAAPDCARLQKRIAQMLEAHGLGHVDVITEW